MTMKIVIALDSFKGTLTAREACAAVKAAIREVCPDAEIVSKPMADGGEGTAMALMHARDGEWVPLRTMGSLPGSEVDGGYAWFDEFGEAVVEMAVVNGLPLLKPEQRNPLKTTTFGTGQLIRHAMGRCAERVFMTVGGSATVDGGVGAAMALGWRFLDAFGKPVGFGGGELLNIHVIEPPADYLVPGVSVLCDVNNPLCGSRGAARMYSPQKGATPDMVERLEEGLAHLAEKVKIQLGVEILELPGAGAAGGLAAGAVAFFDAELIPGIETVMQVSGLAEAMHAADWVITGEGRLDDQSLHGKVVSGVASLATKTSTRTAILAGDMALSEESTLPPSVVGVFPARQEGMTKEYAIAHAEELLYRAALRFAEQFLQNRKTHGDGLK